MSAVGNIPQLPLPALPKAAVTVRAPAQAPALPLPQQTPQASAPQPEVLNTQAAEKLRFAAVKQAAKQYANFNVLGTSTFTIFKDVNGQLVTRSRDWTTGKVTYIPEPDMVRNGDASQVDVLA
jgi:hypothetical protein